MRKLLLYVLSSPLLIIGILFDLVKLPIILFILLPLLVYIWILDLLRGDVVVTPLEFCGETLIIGVEVWWEVING